MTWHPEVIAGAALAALQTLNTAMALDGFYLAGGTGLALQLGHRRSVDLDFFAPSGSDDQRSLTRVESLPQFKVLSRRRSPVIPSRV